MSNCEHGFADRKHCAECMYEGNIAPTRVTVNERPFNAKFAGTCALCDTDIEPGNLIFGRSDGSYIHYRHAPSPRRSR